MSREKAIARIRKLLALAAQGSGASEEESRNAAVAAARLMARHGLAPGDGTPIDTSDAAIADTFELVELKLRITDLQAMLAAQQAKHLDEIRETNWRWHLAVEDIRRKMRGEARKQVKTIARKTAAKERETFAQSGGKARSEKLDDERKTEIGRMGAQARWEKWRERHAG